jgi:hypothetical protein
MYRYVEVTKEDDKRWRPILKKNPNHILARFPESFPTQAAAAVEGRTWAQGLQCAYEESLSPKRNVVEKLEETEDMVTLLVAFDEDDHGWIITMAKNGTGDAYASRLGAASERGSRLQRGETM